MTKRQGVVVHGGGLKLQQTNFHSTIPEKYLRRHIIDLTKNFTINTPLSHEGCKATLSRQRNEVWQARVKTKKDLYKNYKIYMNTNFFEYF